MNTTRDLIMGIIGAILFASASLGQAAEEADLTTLANDNAAFAFDLYAPLNEETGNLFFSPYSISTALAMTYAGARGETARQMADSLRFSLPGDTLHAAFQGLAAHLQDVRRHDDIALNIANALWLQQDFHLVKPFVKLTERHYDAKLFQVNFQEAFEEVRLKINQWVAQQTRDKIQDLLAPGTLSALTRLVLTNAIYFKGRWEMPFDEELTQDDTFWLTAEDSVTTPLMHQHAQFKYAENDCVQVLELPYAGDALAMVVLLPVARDGLAALEAQLQADQAAAWVADAAYREVDVYLPSFTLTTQFSVQAALQALGMTDAFSNRADFSGMTQEADLSISDVIHKAFVDVNEEGTEAAAATAVIVGVTSVGEPQPVPVFRADHPFVFFIRDRQTEAILFVGRVVNPAIR